MIIYNSGKILCNPVTFGNGHRDPNSPYNQFKNAIKKNINQQSKNIKSKIGNSNIEIEIIIYLTGQKSSRSDLDNYLKPIIDALSEEVTFKESQLFKISIAKKIIENKKDEGIEFTISCIM